MANNSEELNLEQIIAKGVKLTPMMQQYYEIKRNYPDILLMFRMGDFYELFFEDARLASKILNISLTHRGKLGDHPIPMAGIPHHAANTYVDRITSQGQKVAICEQVEDPKASKGIVKRAVTQVVSPGMPFDLDKSESTGHSYMASVVGFENGFYLILIDYTTGEFLGFSTNSLTDLIEKLGLYSPKELISYLGQWDEHQKMKDYLKSSSILVSHLSTEYFEEKYTGIYIEKLIPTYKRDQIIKMNKGILKSIGALSYYICSTQSLDSISHMRPFKMINNTQDMKITYPTLVGLEIFPKSKEHYKDSILGFMDVTKTALGSRKLKQVFQSPLSQMEKIQQRQDTVAYLLSDHERLSEVRSLLFDIRDIERIMAKVSTGKVNGPDLINLSNAYTQFEKISNLLSKLPKGVLEKITPSQIEKLNELSIKINKTINDEIGAHLDKGNLIKSGCHKQRDRLQKLSQNATEALLDLELKYREETGISNLKIKSNNVAGYFIEISKSHTKKVPEGFIRRQTLVNNERYQSPELIDFEKEVLAARDKLQKLERKIFEELVSNIKELSQEILIMASNIALIDVFQAFAWTSFQNDFVKPKLLNSKGIHIKQGWHPLIKQVIKDQFVCHDLILDKNVYFGLITGPNMAGKTTVMREVAIIQFLAQLGCYVPATSAELGLTDYIFSRLGASDDIIKGQSTFMVEMSETAEILRHATEKSLIVLDEIGRGTSTYDGLSIAWSLVEHFVQKTKALTLFSTHYHELIDLTESLEGAKNLTVKTINENGKVQFLYKLIEEGAAQSFGLHVANLAGLPQEILLRSKTILEKLESGSEEKVIITPSQSNQLDMFGASDPTPHHNHTSPLQEEFKNLDPLNMTPMEALLKIQDLKENFLN